MAKVIMIQGTMSSVGKSFITAGLCRVFKQDGYRVAPFKSQNMALNSYITDDGLEMGRAQVVQAEAAGVKPDVRMNPILLKPTSENGSQVIVMGKSCGNMKAAEYFKNKKEYIPVIKSAYDSLAGEYDIIVIEGAGSPVEINLKENDIVNMGMAQLVDAPVLLVADIDRGGVFAQLLGTMELLEREEKSRVKGLVINKFRGDRAILEPGLKMIEEKCLRPVAGVVPWSDIRLEDEDSLSGGLLKNDGGADVDIAVIRLRWISNFTDVDAFDTDEDVSIRYVDSPDELKDPDMVILPGSKNTISDMRLLRESGMEAMLRKLSDKGTVIFGICGGYQMMGRKIDDSAGTEGGGSIDGIGLLPINTVFDKNKTTVQVRGRTGSLPSPFEMLSDKPVSGYEIHMGQSSYADTEPDFFSKVCITLNETADTDKKDACIDGCVNGSCMGTYIHGIFDDTDFREALIDMLLKRKGLIRRRSSRSYAQFKEEQYDALADLLRANMDIRKIYDLMENAGNGSLDPGSFRDLRPAEIEEKSMEIIGSELERMAVVLDHERAPLIKRAIHTTADFDYVYNLCFSDNAVEVFKKAIHNGACIVTDTQMAKAGINKNRLASFDGEVFCFMSDEDIVEESKRTGRTRASLSMDKAVKLHRDVIFAIGNAPTALIRLHELITNGMISPKGIIAVPVGFVNVVEAKELIMELSCPYIAAKGRKGGSNVAAAIVNSLLYLDE